jgi:hypothetical protein
MAESNAHKLGQIIGEALEDSIRPHLMAFASKHGLYLDQKGPRRCRSSAKVSWRDINGNSHDLDFVLERGGTDEAQGVPVAFIETAWRRYTKHSRAKAQEIQGAIEPLVQKYRHISPFKGVVIAGVFTPGALEQLRSLGFAIVFIAYPVIVEAFATQGVDISFDEKTSERELGKKVQAYRKLSPESRAAIAKVMISAVGLQLVEFLKLLEQAVNRKVTVVRVLALFGKVIEARSIAEAVRAVENTREGAGGVHPMHAYELQVEFGNGDQINGRFSTKEEAAAFLRRVEPTVLKS